MADIGEEGRLGAVDFRQRLGPPAFGLIGQAISGSRGDLAGDEVQEPGIAFIVETKRIEPGDDEAALADFAGREDGEHHRLFGRLPPATAGKIDAERSPQIAHQNRRLQSQRLGERPHAVAPDRQALLNRGMSWIDPGERCEPGLVAALLHHVNHHEGEIARLLRQGARATRTGLVDAASLRRSVGEFAQQGKLPLADHALRIVGVGAEDAAGRPVVVRNRTIGERVVGLLGKAVALHDQELCLDIGASIAAARFGKQRTDILPDLVPHDRRWTSERPGMFAADDGLVGVVVEVDELLSPADPDRLLRGEHDSDGSLQALRPLLRRTDRGTAPIELQHQPGELATSRKQPVPLRRAEVLILPWLPLIRQTCPHPYYARTLTPAHPPWFRQLEQKGDD